MMLAIVVVLLVTTLVMPWAFSATLGLSLSCALPLLQL